MTPILSIVTGTFNRLDYLRAMLKSARDQLPVGLAYEFIIVDGGSTDGTLAWCRQQSDVVLIEHGELRGAITAFCDGARAAQGDYVLLANDDILFHEGAILRALVHLNAHPDCGAVAFADNRKVAGKAEDAQGYGVQTVPAYLPDGTRTSVPYAQVGLYRRWLGELAGWWGDTDPVMQQARAYGGDNYLSARIWEMGYTVEPVPGCAVLDRIPQDELRRMNGAHDGAIASPYHQRYPNGVPIASLSTPPHDETERLRILYLPLFSPGYGRYKRGLFDALNRVGWCIELDYTAQASRFLPLVEAWQPHVILTQFHDAHLITAAHLESARQRAPEAVFVNWNGDVYFDQLTAPDMLELLKRVDLQTVVNADVLPVYAENGIHAAYWQIGFESTRDELPEMPAHDLLFMGNAYSPARKELGALLRQIDANAGLYGYGWDVPSGNSFYDFDKGAALYHRCAIAIGDSQWGGKGFVSNRLFEALANGAFLMHQTIAGLEELTGLVDGVHYVAWQDFDDLRAKIATYLPRGDVRAAIARQGEAYVREFHSFDARVKELFEELIPSLQAPDTVDVWAGMEADPAWMD